MFILKYRQEISVCLLIIVCLVFCVSCSQKSFVGKKNTERFQDTSHFPLLENVALPFSSKLEHYLNKEHLNTSEADTFYVYFPECSVDFLLEYYKNTMEQLGWILGQEFFTIEAVILCFFSVTRTCFVYIYKDHISEYKTKKVMLCVGQVNV